MVETRKSTRSRVPADSRSIHNLLFERSAFPDACHSTVSGTTIPESRAIGFRMSPH